MRDLLLGAWWSWLVTAVVVLSIPIILHIWKRQRATRIPWGAMALVHRAAQARHPRMRLTRAAHLAVRLLVLLFLLVAVMVPQAWAAPWLEFIWPDASPAGRLSPRRTHHVLLLDATLSMSRELAGEPLFDRAKAAALEYLDRRWCEGDACSVICLAQPPVLMTPDPVGNAMTAAGRLGDAVVTHGPGDLMQTCRLLEGVLGRHHGSGLRQEVLVLTDLQVATWAPGQADRRTSFAEALSRVSDLATIRLLKVGGPGFSSLAVSETRLTSPLVLAGEEAILEVAVRSWGEGKLQSVPVRLWQAGPVDDGGTTPTWAPAASGLCSLQHVAAPDTHERAGTAIMRLSFPSAGAYLLCTQVDSTDGLAADDSRYLVVTVRDRPRALLVDGQAGAPAEETESHFLRTALDNPRWRLNLTVIDPTSLPAALAAGPSGEGGPDVVFLCNVPALSQPSREKLLQYLRDGGCVVIFMGDRIDPSAYRQLSAAEAGGFLPFGVLIGDERTRSRRQGDWIVDPGDYTHPLLDEFRGFANSGLNTVRVRHYWPVTPLVDADARVCLRIGAAFARDSAEGKGDPLLIDAPAQGRGRVLVMTTGCHIRDGSWPLNPSYVPLMQEMLLLALRHRQTSTSFGLVGQPIATTDRGDLNSVSILAARGGGRPPRVESCPRCVHDGANVGTRAGFYRRETGSGQVSGGQPWHFAVNCDCTSPTAESQPALLTRGDMQHLYPLCRWSSEEPLGPQAAILEEPIVSLSQLCLLIGVCFLLLDLGFATWTARPR